MKIFQSFSFSRNLQAAVVLAVFAAYPLCSHGQTAPAQTSASTNSEQVAELQKVADRWDDAVDQRDQYALELVLAPDYIEITDMGAVFSRDQVVSQLVRKDAPHYSLIQKVITVRLVGDVAIVNGTYDRVHEGGKLSHEKTTDEKGVFSQVYMRARNSWACINSQQTLIQGTATKASKKKSKNDSGEKPVDQNLGFHFPGFHHSNDTSPKQ